MLVSTGVRLLGQILEIKHKAWAWCNYRAPNVTSICIVNTGRDHLAWVSGTLPNGRHLNGRYFRTPFMDIAQCRCPRTDGRIQNLKSGRCYACNLTQNLCRGAIDVEKLAYFFNTFRGMERRERRVR